MAIDIRKHAPSNLVAKILIPYCLGIRPQNQDEILTKDVAYIRFVEGQAEARDVIIDRDVAWHGLLGRSAILYVAYETC